MSTTTITFNQLRKIKDSLPAGSMQLIAKKMNMDPDDVRNYFGGDHYKEGHAIGLHVEQGPDGGVVVLDDVTILEMAKDILTGKLSVN